MTFAVSSELPLVATCPGVHTRPRGSTARQGYTGVMDTPRRSKPRARTIHQPSGPEAEMVNSYLSERVSSSDFVAFLEPELDTGFPDLVLVKWRPHDAESWPATRASLTTADLKLAHALYTSGGALLSELERLLQRPVRTAAERLESSGLAYRRGERLMPVALRRSFGASKIISIEAKVSDWRAALHQATRNTWFASHSYILVPSLPRNAEPIISAASDAGVGVLTLDHSLHNPALRAPNHGLPRSYASWLVNEWAWQAQRSIPECK